LTYPQPPSPDPRYPHTGIAPGFAPGMPGTAPGMVPPPPPAPTSAAATASLVLAILGSMCLGPIGAIAAIILGAVALWDIHSSQGKKSGSVLAWVGLVIGSLTTLAYAAVILLLVYTGSSAASSPAPPPIYMPPPLPTATAVPSPSPGTGTTETLEVRTTETHVGAVTVVDIGLSEPSLDAALRKQRSIAEREGHKLVLQTTSSRCRPCQGVAAALSDPKMQTALTGVRLVRVDVRDFHEELTDLGIPHESIPGFFFLGTDMSPRDGIHGGEWDDDVADNIAPVVGPFVRGTYTRRRHPYLAPRGPSPRGTAL